MYIFRWLMKHPIIILALYFVSIAAILYSMTGGGSTDKSETVAETAIEQKAETTDVNMTEAPTIEPSTLTSALVTGDDTNEGTNAEVQTAVATNETVTDGSISAVDSASADNVEVIVDDESVPASEVTESSTQFAEMSEEELLLVAREAYWNNGLEESAQIYQLLVEQNPDVVDYKGELGNVYWRQGFPKKAAELYAAISLPMIEEGESSRVANMVGFIGLFYPEKATEIHNKLQENK